MLKILVLNYEYPPLGGGGGEVTESLALEFSKNEIEQLVITSWFPGLKFYEKINDNLKIIRAPTLRFSKHRATVFTMASYVASAFLPLLISCMFFKPNLIHAHFLMPVGPLAYAMKKIFKIPYVLTVHCGDVPGVDVKIKNIYNILFRPAAKIVVNASRVTSVSKEFAGKMRELFAVSIDFISNAISSDWLCDEAPEKCESLKLVFAGRLVAIKNVNLLIDSVSELSDQMNISLDIYGDGPEYNRLTLKSKETNAPVCFHGWVDRAHLKKAFKEADIFLLPSDIEGFSIAAIQAAASGCALILSGIPANEPLVEKGINGYFCERNVQSISEAIRNCEDNLESLKANSRKKAGEFLWEKIALQYVDIFKDITERT